MGDKSFTAIIFDLDGTLIEVDDIKKRGDEILEKTLTEFDVKRTRFQDRLRFWFSGGEFLHLLEKWGIKEGSRMVSFLKVLSQNEYDVKRRLIETGEARLYRDAGILNNLRGKLKLGVVSNSSRRTVELELERFNLEKYFDSVVALGDFNSKLRPKPDPDGILQCIREIQEAPSSSIFVGDNITDVIAGNRSGIHTALLVRGRQKTQAQKEESAPPRIDFKLRSLMELGAIIELPCQKTRPKT